MFRNITNAQGQHTARPTSADRERSPEGAETVLSGCWRGARTLGHEEVPYTRMPTYGTMDSYGDRPLTQRAVRAPDKAAQPAPADETLCNVLLSKQLPLKLSLPERPFAGENGIINFDCVERGDFYCLEPDLKHQAFYLRECESGRSFIDLPLKPGNGQPRYLLTPSLRDDFVGIVFYDEFIRVWRDKNYSPKPMQDILFMPYGRSVHKNCDSYWAYQSFPGAIHEGGEALEKPKVYENIFWGQFNRKPLRGSNFPVDAKWTFYCQDSKEPHDRITILSAEQHNLAFSLTHNSIRL